jgi:hypothetical protein
MERLIYQNIVGYSTASYVKLLKEESVFQMVLEKSSLAS